MICGKIIHATRQEAKSVIDNAKSERLAGMYFCGDCNGWHVHSKSFKAKKGMKGSRVEKKVDTTPHTKTVEESLTFGYLRIHDHRTFVVK